MLGSVLCFYYMSPYGGLYEFIYKCFVLFCWMQYAWLVQEKKKGNQTQKLTIEEKETS